MIQPLTWQGTILVKPIPVPTQLKELSVQTTLIMSAITYQSSYEWQTWPVSYIRKVNTLAIVYIDCYHEPEVLPVDNQDDWRTATSLNAEQN